MSAANCPRTDRHTDRHTDTQANTQTDRHTDRQTHRQTDRQTHRQTHRQTGRGITTKSAELVTDGACDCVRVAKKLAGNSVDEELFCRCVAYQKVQRCLPILRKKRFEERTVYEQ